VTAKKLPANRIADRFPPMRISAIAGLVVGREGAKKVKRRWCKTPGLLPSPVIKGRRGQADLFNPLAVLARAARSNQISATELLAAREALIIIRSAGPS
jgi:hypothetical protein